jgi:hypothetical protein
MSTDKSADLKKEPEGNKIKRNDERKCADIGKKTD